MIHAAIDFGTNAIRLLLAEELSSHRIHILHRKRLVVRLGEGFGREKKILPESLQRAVEAVRKFSAEAEGLGAQRVRLVGTSVWREAENREPARQLLYRETGLWVQIISGEDEARLTAYGVTQSLGLPLKNLIIVDIGGGSSEVIYFPLQGSPTFSSISLGAVWLTEKFFLHDPPSDSEWEKMIMFCQSTIAKSIPAGIPAVSPAGIPAVSPAIIPAVSPDVSPAVPPDPRMIFVGTGGTVTTLAALSQRQSVYNPDRINNSVIPLSGLEELADYLRSMPVCDRKKVCGMGKGRADIILAGAAILVSLMKALRVAVLTLSDAGLSEGIIWHEISPSPFLEKFS
jgi:exopolyphosphatase/guanosine-5'-triphosphate,3'-diphosphate pyrophosphatase